MSTITEGRLPLDTTSWTEKMPVQIKYKQFSEHRSKDGRLIAYNLNAFFNEHAIDKNTVADMLSVNKSVVSRWNTIGYSSSLNSSIILSRDIVHCEISELLCAKKWPIEAPRKLAMYYRMIGLASSSQHTKITKKLIELLGNRSADQRLSVLLRERFTEYCEDMEIQFFQMLGYKKTVNQRKILNDLMTNQPLAMREQTLLFFCYSTGISPDYFMVRDYSYAKILVDGEPIRASRRVEISQFLSLSPKEQIELLGYITSLML